MTSNQAKSALSISTDPPANPDSRMGRVIVALSNLLSGHEKLLNIQDRQISGDSAAWKAVYESALKDHKKNLVTVMQLVADERL